MEHNEETIHPVFTSLQRPMEFWGFQGRYIYWAAGTAGCALFGLLIGMIASGIIIGVAVAAVFLSVGGSMIFIKQKKGLHSKKEETGIFIYTHSCKI